jgi:hypothetical protein
MLYSNSRVRVVVGGISPYVVVELAALLALVDRDVRTQRTRKAGNAQITKTWRSDGKNVDDQGLGEECRN